MLRNHESIQRLLKAACSGKMGNGNPLPSSGPWDYSVSGTDGAFLYLKDYFTIFTAGLTGNLAVTFLGSYDAQYSISGNSLDVVVRNSSTIQSATHPPVLGYTKWWRDNIGAPLDRRFQKGPMSRKTQTINLHFDLSCACKK